MQSSSKKQLKTHLSYLQTQPSISNSQDQYQNFFARKPSVSNLCTNSEKQPKNSNQIVQAAKEFAQNYIQDNLNNSQSSGNLLLDKKSTHLQNFCKKQSYFISQSSNYNKQYLFDPDFTKNLYQTEKGVISKKNNRKNIGNNINQDQINRSVSIKQEYSSCQQGDLAQHLDKTAQKVSFQSISNECVSNYSTSKNTSLKKGMNNWQVHRSLQAFIKDRAYLHECLYCINNKRTVNILIDKLARLKDQNQLKADIIKELCQKYQLIKKINSDLQKTISVNVELYKRKQELFLKEREDLHIKIQKLKMDISGAKQKLKNYSIQNSILLRYKDQYQLLIKQFDQIKDQNQLIQRRYSVNANWFQNNELWKQKQKIVLLQKELGIEKIHHDFLKVEGGDRRQRFLGDEDFVSLNLSEQSYQPY